MKNIFAAILSQLLFLCATAQKSTLFGNFVFDDQVFQYQYKKDGSIHSLKLSALAGESWLHNLDMERLDKGIKLFDSVLANDELPAEVKESISWLPDFLSQLQAVAQNATVWKSHSKKIDSLLGVIENKNLDTLQKIASSAGVDNPVDLLKMYKGFLQVVQEPRQTSAIPFAELKPDVFQKVFEKQMAELYAFDGKTINPSKKKDMPDKANEIMYEIRARAEFEDSEPVTAYLTLKRKYIALDVPVKYRFKRGQNTTDTTGKVSVNFKVSNLQIEFEDGTIKHILADLIPEYPEYTGYYGNHPIRFRNNVPISVSGKFDPELFSLHRIFAGNTKELMNTLKEEAKRQLGNHEFEKEQFKKTNTDIYFDLSNLLDYLIITESENEDYSPANGKVELNANRTIIELKKDKSSKILSARMYTDLVGLNSDNPNGLVQVELSRKINLLTERGQVKNFPRLGKIKLYTGGLTFIEPRFTLNKIEETNRYYVVDSFSMDKTKSLADSQNYFYLNPIEILRHQQWTIGLTVNLLKVNFINKKTNFQLNAYFGYGRVPVADSFQVTENKIRLIQSRNQTSVNTAGYGLSGLFEFKPDSRWGLSLGQDARFQNIYHPRFSLDNRFAKIFLTTWFDGYMKTNASSKLFLRFRKHWVYKNQNYNFYQLQLGYELELFKAN